MKTWITLGTCIALGLSAPAFAQPEQATGPELSAEKLEERRATFAWLLGTWNGDHMFGPNSNRSGAAVTFYLEQDGTVSARLDRLSPWMESSEKRFRDMVGKRIIRGINASGAPRSVWSNSASGGEVFDKNSGNWTNLGIIYVSRDDGKLSHLGAMSDFSHWVKVSGSAGSTGTRDAPSSRNTTPSSPGAKSADPQPNAEPTQDSSDDSQRRCHLITYIELLTKGTSKAITDFDQKTDRIAVYDDSLPAVRLYPSPIKSSADIPDFMTAEQYLTLDRLEVLVAETVKNRGPDDALKGYRTALITMHRRAADQYEGAGIRAADAFKPCPDYSESVPQAFLLAAETNMDALRQRRDKQLKPLLAEADALNETLMRKFYGELDDARSLESKAKAWVSEQIKDAFKKEGVEPAKIDALIPQLDALRDQYRRLAEAGTPVSDQQQSADLAEALKRAGIAYDPARDVDKPLDTAQSITAKLFNYMKGQIVGPGPKDIFSYYSKVAGYVGLVKDTAEIINAMKNLYDLWGIRQELMPVALAAAEDRAYLIGLIERYDRVEAEYLTLQNRFKEEVNKSAAQGNRTY
ncbi:hypothetical protein [Erythrobacter sp. F6033]|uniref:hypothetical protein n=1 Tax=Erythrobacter sp. F6033 TaxID=2926401 RepID=UPI001FF1943E|nr:hypothetical protein [Erythrobacter sp. F6033]MCK0128650.1 hypothetical protein [Erythrobacter sp. F6033]